jgi:hypothetical protein
MEGDKVGAPWMYLYRYDGLRWGRGGGKAAAVDICSHVCGRRRGECEFVQVEIRIGTGAAAGPWR